VPAYRDLEPVVALSYDSRGENGWLGVGWRLTGLSSIRRATPGRGAPSHTSDDIFVLDGAELIPCSPGVDSPSCKYPASQTYHGYTSRIESYRRIAYDPSAGAGGSWYVWSKDGTRNIFKPRTGSSATVHAWDLSRVEDARGNSVSYEYSQKGPSAGVAESYLDAINYGGFKVKFHYEQRPDPFTYANGESLVTIGHRLRAIDVLAGEARARVYTLQYIVRGETGRSFLSEMRQYGRDAQLGPAGEVVNAASIASMPPVRFEAAAGIGDSWAASEVSNAQWGLPFEGGRPLTMLDGVAVPVSSPFYRSVPKNLGDFDGDGRTDWVLASPDLVVDGIARHRSVLFTAVLSGKRAPIYVQTTLPWSFPGTFNHALSADMNGDGRTDLVFIVKGEPIPDESGNIPRPTWAFFLHFVVAFSQGDGTFAWATPNSQATLWETREQTIYRVATCLTGDVDGDRRQDIVCSFTKGDDTHHMGIALARGDGTFDISERPMPFAAVGETRLMALGDTNGDGLADPMFLDFPQCPPDPSPCSVNYELVTALLGNGGYQFERQPTDWARGEPLFFAADINGDGKADYVVLKSVVPGADGAIQTAMRQLDGTYLLNQQPVRNVLIRVENIVSVGDANGDGKTDLLVLSRQPPHVPGCSPNLTNEHVNLHRVLSRGNGYFDLPSSWTECGNSRELDISWADTSSTQVQPEAGDLDGNGTADFVIAVAKRGQPFITLREDLSPQPMANAFDWKPVEVNGDGKKDWVYVRNTPTGPLILTLLSDGSSYRQVSQSPFPGTSAFTVIRNWKVMDVDADGRDDLVYLAYITPAEGIQVGVWFSRGDGTWRFTSQQVLVGEPESFRDTLSWRPMDVNRDGRMDLVRIGAVRDASISNAVQSLHVSTLLSNGDGTWVDGRSTTIHWLNTEVLEPRGYPSSDVLNWRPADVNGDGRADLVYVTYLRPGVRVHALLSGEDGGWHRGRTTSTRAWHNSPDGDALFNTGSWTQLDVNGDGMTDLVHLSPVDRRPGRSTSLRVHTLFSHGNGGWTAQVQVPTGAFTGDMVNWRVGRVTGDSRVGLVHYHVAPPAVVVTTLSQLISGAWNLSSPDINVSTATRDIFNVHFELADLDGNGQEDLVRFDLLPSGMRLFSVKGEHTPDLLRRVRRGFGGTTDIQYEPSSRSAANDLTDGCRLPVGVAFRTAFSIEVRDGRSSVLGGQTFAYSCARWSHRERAHLSWRQVSAHRPASANRPASTVVTLYKTSDECLTQPIHTFLHDKMGRVHNRDITAPLSPGSAPPYKCLASYRNRVALSQSSPGLGLNIYTYYTYDEFGNITSISEYGAALAENNDERTTTIAYRPAVGPYIVGLPHQVTVSEGVQPARRTYRYLYFCYDGDNGTDSRSCAGSVSKGLLTAAKRVNDNGWYDTNIFAYDTHGNLTGATDANGNGWTVPSYDPTHHIFPERACNALKHCQSLEWDPAIQQVSGITDINGQRTEFRYDGLGRPDLTLLPDGGTLRYHYLDWGNPQRQRVRIVAHDGSWNGLWIETYFDGLGRPYLAQRKGDAPERIFAQLTAYADSTSLIHRQSHWYATDETPVYEVYEYDESGRLSRKKHPDDNAAHWSYDNDDRESWITAYDERGSPRVVYLDAYSRISRVRERPDEPDTDAVYLYNPMDEPTMVVAHQGHGQGVITTGYTWDLRGHLRQDVDPNTGTWSYPEHDRLGNLRRQIDPKGNWTRYDYDVLNRIKRKQYASSREVTWFYDEPSHGASRGRLTAVADSAQFRCPITPGRGYTTEELFYDGHGRLNRRRQCIEGQTYEFKFGYDRLGRVDSITYPDGEEVKYTYDSAGRTQSVSGYVKRFEYDAADRLTVAELANGVRQGFTYDPHRKWLTSASVVRANTVLYEARYSDYFPNGLLRVSASSTHQMNLVYDYDRLNRLTDVSGDLQQHLEYDAVGNITFNSDFGPYFYRYTGRQQGCGTSTSTLIPCPHAVKQVGASEFIYDDRGNLAFVSGDHAKGIKPLSIEWNADNEPSIFQGADRVPTEVHYDSRGERVSRSRNGETTLYFGPLMEVTSGAGGTNHRITKYYYAGSLLLARKDDVGTYWYHLDHLRSTRLLTDEAGTAAARFNYRPFGTMVGASGSATSDIQFAGHRSDTASGLVYMRARYYAPTIGRFISPDPLAPQAYGLQALNRFSYAYNDPVGLVDPSGLQPVRSDLMISTSPHFGGPVGRDVGVGWIHGPLLGWAAPPQSPDLPTLTEADIERYSRENMFSTSLCPTCHKLDPSSPIRPTTRAEKLMIGALPFALVGIFVAPEAATIGGALYVRAAVQVAVRCPTCAAGLLGALRILSGTSDVVQGPRGVVARNVLERAMKSPGPTTSVVTNLTRPPQVGRKLSVAFGEGAEDLANAAQELAGRGGQLYRAEIPNKLIMELERIGLIERPITQMGGVYARELQILPAASEFIAPLFKF
jgi:RHS repeat-associated protein